MNRIMNFITSVKDSFINVDSYISKKKFSDALKYLIILLVIISFLTIIPIAYGLFSIIDIEKSPDFEIKNGKLTVYAVQPLYVDKNFIIDTTGNITRPVVDEEGQGILITEDTIIYKRQFDERRIEISAIENFFTNKEEFKKLVNIFLLILLPIIFIVMFLINIIKYLFYISILSVLGYILIRRKDTFKSVFSICIYSFTPYIVLSYINSYIQFYVETIGLVWTLIIFGLVLKRFYFK